VQPASTNKEFSILQTCFPIPCFVACSCLQSVLCTPKEFAFQAAGIWELSLGLGTLIPSGGQSQIGDPSRSIPSNPIETLTDVCVALCCTLDVTAKILLHRCVQRKGLHNTWKLEAWASCVLRNSSGCAEGGCCMCCCAGWMG